MYALTGNPHWLATAQLNADYWLEHTSGRAGPGAAERLRRTESRTPLGILRCRLRRGRIDHARLPGRR